MRKYLILINSIMFLGFCSCNQAQESEKTIIEPCFKQYFFKTPESYSEFEKLLIVNGFIDNTNSESYQKFFSEFFPYNNYKKENNFYEKKRLLAKILNKSFKETDSLNLCLNELEKESINDFPKLTKLSEAIKEVSTIIASAEIPERWEDLRMDKIWIKNTEKDWFTNLDVKYLSLFVLYKENSNYTDDMMEKNIRLSKIEYGERIIDNDTIEVNDIIEVLLSDGEDDAGETVIESTIIEEDELPIETTVNEEKSIKNKKNNGALDENTETVNTSIKPLQKLPATTIYNPSVESLESLLGNEYLDLSNRKWNRVPNIVWNEKQATTLIIANNHLKSISNKIGQLINLEDIIISDNNLASLPTNLKKLIKLTSFYAENNELTKIPDEIGYLIELTHIDFSDNKINTISKTIGKLQNLEVLGITNNRLSELPD